MDISGSGTVGDKVFLFSLELRFFGGEFPGRISISIQLLALVARPVDGKTAGDCSI